MIKIMGSHNGVAEWIDETDNTEDAEYLVNEYRMAFGSQWVIWYE